MSEVIRSNTNPERVQEFLTDNHFHHFLEGKFSNMMSINSSTRERKATNFIKGSLLNRLSPSELKIRNKNYQPLTAL